MQSTFNTHLFVFRPQEGIHWSPQLWSISCPACLRHRVGQLAQNTVLSVSTSAAVPQPLKSLSRDAWELLTHSCTHSMYSIPCLPVTLLCASHSRAARSRYMNRSHTQRQGRHIPTRHQAHSRAEIRLPVLHCWSGHGGGSPCLVPSLVPSHHAHLPGYRTFRQQQQQQQHANPSCCPPSAAAEGQQQQQITAAAAVTAGSHHP